MPETFRFLGRVISDGRITIPELVRITLNIKDGDYVEIQIERVRKSD